MSSTSQANPPPLNTITDQNLHVVGPAASFRCHNLNVNNISEPSYPPPNVFQTSSAPQVSMPPPTHQSNLSKFPITSLPSHRDPSAPLNFQHSSPPPHDYSLPTRPITSVPLLPPAHIRLAKPPPYSQPLLSHISHLENRIRTSPHLQEILTDMSNRASPIATGVTIDTRIQFSRTQPDEDPLCTHGFPKTDVDADYCLEDTPGLSSDNFNLLKETLYSHLSRVRRHAQETLRDLDACLAPQVTLRAIPEAEMEKRIQFVVKKFCEARQHILHKFRGYVRNRRWIENVATRQRRGCLTHRQNNILRLWLFTHFDNPYPDSADKRKLISDTSLNVTQINNWLINARSRVWKPTVEIMSGEKIRKDMKKRQEAQANTKVRDWELGEYSIALAETSVVKREQNHEAEYRSRNSVPSAPVSTAPGSHQPAQSTSLGIPSLTNGIHTSAGGTTASVDAGSSIPHEVIPTNNQTTDALAEVGAGWLVPQPFGSLDFNADGHNQQAD